MHGSHGAAPRRSQRSRSPSSSSRCSSAGVSATSSPSRCAGARAPSRGSSTRARRPPTGGPGTHHVLARVFKDIYPRFKTMRGYYVERKGGWDCHGLPVEIAVEQELGISSKAEIEAYGIAEFNAKCRESVFTFLEDWDAADRADRLLGRPRRRLPHARHQLRRERLVGAEDDLGQGAALRGPQGRARTARAAAPRSPATRSRSATATSSTRASTCASRFPRAAGRWSPATSCSSGRRRRGRSSPTPPSRSTRS